MTYDVVEGTTAALQFQLLDNGIAIDLTGCTVALILTDRTGTTVASPGTVAVVTAASGKVKLTPTDANVFDPALGPYYARWKITDGSGLISFVPTSTRDVWNVVGQ